jgi:hypothetical protein
MLKIKPAFAGFVFYDSLMHRTDAREPPQFVHA